MTAINSSLDKTYNIQQEAENNLRVTNNAISLLDNVNDFFTHYAPLVFVPLVCSSETITQLGCRLGIAITAKAVHWFCIEFPLNEMKTAKQAAKLEETFKNPNVEDITKKKALLIKASNETDYNGAISSGSNLSLYKELSKTHEITLKTMDSIHKIRDFMNSFEETTLPKYNVIILAGHGNEHSVRLGKDFSLEEEGGKPDTTTKETLSLLGKVAEKSSFVVLQSCSTGKGDSNIAQCISRYMNHSTVIAPSEDLNGYASLTFPEGTPTFIDNTFCLNRNVTKTYVNGENLTQAR